MATQPILNFTSNASRFAAKPTVVPSSVAQTHSSNSRLKLCASSKEKLGVVVKPMERPRIVLKVIRMEKTVGIGLDQVVAGIGTIPLSPYYFWRKENALQQLQMLLRSKPWIPHSQMEILVSQASHIYHLWPDSACPQGVCEKS